eukprot:365357-Chlamydomonas_euryale.AAC.2
MADWPAGHTAGSSSPSSASEDRAECGRAESCDSKSVEGWNPAIPKSLPGSRLIKAKDCV